MHYNKDENCKNHRCRGGLCPAAFGVGFGVAQGLGMFIAGLLATFWGRGYNAVHVTGSLYYGYHATILGSVIGLIWGLVIGFIFGFIVAWVYNRVCSRCTCKRCAIREDEKPIVGSGPTIGTGGPTAGSGQGPTAF